jgi:hypothetical protein
MIPVATLIIPFQHLSGRINLHSNGCIQKQPAIDGEWRGIGIAATDDAVNDWLKGRGGTASGDASIAVS